MTCWSTGTKRWFQLSCGIEGDDAGQVGDRRRRPVPGTSSGQPARRRRRSLRSRRWSARRREWSGVGGVSSSVECSESWSHPATGRGTVRIVRMNKYEQNRRVAPVTGTKVADGVAFLRRRIQEGSLMSTQLSEAAQTRKAVSNILKGSAGNLVEWYDLYVYTVFAAYFQSHFFNSKDELQAGLEAMAVFSTSFLMRPIGAWFFGRYADRKGRKAALTLSVTMMSAGSFAIAHPADHAADRRLGTAPADPRPADPGLLRRRRIRHQRHVHVRGRHLQAPRILLQLPVRHPDRRPDAGPAGPRDPAERTMRQGRSDRVGLAHSVSRSAAWPRSWSCGCAAPWKRPSPRSRSSAAKARPRPAKPSRAP